MRYFFVTLLCLFLAAPVPLALPSLAQSAEMDSIVAVVNNDVITRREVEREIVRVSANLRERELPVPDDAVVRQEALDYLIDRRLQIQLADQLGVQVPDDALEKELDRMRERLGGEKKLRQTAREKFGMSHEEFYEWVRTDIRLQALFVRAVYAQVRVSDEEVRRFLETETTVVEEREYRVARIFLKTPKDEGGREERRALAERLRGEAAEGADFAELAREHSEGEKAAEGGDLGFRREEDLPDIFVAEAANLEEGEVGRVLETGAGLHIIKLLERRGGELREKSRRVRVRHILAPAENKRLLENVLRELEEGGDFARLARERSADRESGKKGGDLGWLDEDKLPSYLAGALAGMKEGELSGFVESPFGWHLLRLEKREERDLNAEELKERAKEALRERHALARRKSWLRRLRGRAYVSVVDPAFQREEGA